MRESIIDQLNDAQRNLCFHTINSGGEIPDLMADQLIAIGSIICEGLRKNAAEKNK